MKLSTFNFQLSTLIVLAVLFMGCENNGMTAGDPDYWTTSRGQFTAEIPQGDHTVTMYFLGNGDGTATVTFDGSNPLHWAGSSNATVSVLTYKDTIVIPELVLHAGQNLRVTAIGKEAFMGCRELVKVEIPASVTSFGEGAFAICTSLKSLNIPSGIDSIPSACFGQCQSLDSVTIPSSVKYIGGKAFYGCKHLHQIHLSEGLERIDDMAFYACSSEKLLDITLPASLTQIGAHVFGGYDATYCHILSYTPLSTTPPALSGALYYRPEGLTEDPVVYVPAGAKAAYQAAENWNKLIIREQF